MRIGTIDESEWRFTVDRQNRPVSRLAEAASVATATSIAIDSRIPRTAEDFHTLGKTRRARVAIIAPPRTLQVKSQIPGD